MRLWVFVSAPYKSQHAPYALQRANTQTRSKQITVSNKGFFSRSTEDTLLTMHSLSIVLPIYNEEVVIAATLNDVLDTLKADATDFEIIAINDGSSDSTGDILAALAATTPQLRIVTHEHNQGYGAALVDGFAAASKELTLFMDSDGQFDIADLPRLLTFIDSYDAVIGYRQQRQDTEMRKLNTWGWKTLVGFMLGVHVRDIDCAFKLLRTGFLHEHVLQTRGAMINAELLYTLKHAGCTYHEVAVQHLPRQGGRATGAKLRVIVRAFCELFAFAWKQQHSTELRATATQISQ
jgi:glycosyltransferase involved in cell wall biosynthesis